MITRINLLLLAALVVCGMIPYIALQLKAVSASLGTILTHLNMTTGATPVQIRAGEVRIARAGKSPRN